MAIDGKYHKNLSFKEASAIFGFGRNNFIELLRKQGILLKTNGRNIPADRYIRLGWFDIDFAKIEKEKFEGIVPKVKISTKGFESIKKLLEEKWGDEFKEKIKKELDEEIEKLQLSKHDVQQRMVQFSDDKKKTGMFVLDLGTDQQKILLKYDYERYQIWQGSNT